MLIAVVIIILVVTIAVVVREEVRHRQLLLRARERAAMLSLLSHQIRTPLTHIRLFSDLLKNEELGEMRLAQVEVLNKLDAQTVKAFRLLKMFLDYSGIGSECVVCHQTSFDVREVIQAAIDALHESLQTKKHKLNFVRGKKKMMVYQDPTILHGILEAVLENAVMYTPDDGKIDLRIEDAGSSFVIEIQDNGIGIADGEKQRIFEKFFRGKQARTLNPDGDGLGLFVTKQLLALTKGSIRFTSKAGKGSTFYIRLPKAKSK